MLDDLILATVRAKRKWVLSASLVCLALLGAWLLTGPSRVEIHGPFSAQDVAELKKLGRTENRRAIKSDWSSSPRNVTQLTRVARRFLSEHVVRIERVPNDRAVVTVGTSRAASEGTAALYLFVKSGPRWKRAPVEFE